MKFYYFQVNCCPGVQNGVRFKLSYWKHSRSIVIHVFHTLWLLDNHVTLWNAKQETGVKKHNTSVSHLNNKGRLLSLKRWRYSRLYNITIFKLLIFVNKVRMASAFGYIMLLNVVLSYLYSIFSQSAWDVWIIYIYM